MQIENLTNPGVDPADGDEIQITYPNGAVVKQHYFAPVTPEPVVPPVQARHITRLAFLSRFTDGEAVAIDLASIGATVPAASMRRYTTKVNASTFIDLDRADTRAGVMALESAGLLAAGRALVILDAPVTDQERYRG